MPAPRPRARIIAPKGRKPVVSMYSPKEYSDWQKEVLAALKKVEAPLLPFEGPVEVFITSVCERPKATKLFAPKPDTDNYAKGTLDVITKDGRFWQDDTQVVDLHSRKRWSSPDHSAGVTVRIIPVDPKVL